MTGLFLLKKGFVLSSLMVPLLFGTFVWSIYTWKMFTPLSKSVNLSSVFEVQRGEESAEVSRMRAGHPVTWSQRYAFLGSISMISFKRHTVISIGEDMHKMMRPCM